MGKVENRPIGLIAIMAEEQLNAIKKGEIESFMESFCMNGDEEASLREWFHRFKVKAARSKEAIMSTLQIEKCTEHFYEVWIVIDFNYEDDESASAAFHYKMKYHEVKGKIVIVEAAIL